MNGREIISELRQPTRELRDAIPDTWAGFAQLHQEAVSDGVIPGRIKELMAVAIAVAEGCDGCIAYHARAAVHKGATEAELNEALGVSLLMAGGPASVYAPKALEMFRDFKEAALVTHD